MFVVVVYFVEINFFLMVEVEKESEWTKRV